MTLYDNSHKHFVSLHVHDTCHVLFMTGSCHSYVINLKLSVTITVLSPVLFVLVLFCAFIWSRLCQLWEKNPFAYKSSMFVDLVWINF